MKGSFAFTHHVFVVIVKKVSEGLDLEIAEELAEVNTGDGLV